MDNRNPNSTLMNQIIGLGYRLKSREVELGSLNFIKVRLPQQFRIVDTARIYSAAFDILGGVRATGQIRQDAMIFDLLQDITVSYYYNGQQRTGTLDDFLDDLDRASNNQDVIRIDNNEFQRLLDSDALVAGSQAKSGINQHPFNNFDVSINQAINLGNGLIHARILSNLVEWYELSQTQAQRHGYAQGSSLVRATHNFYNAIFNFLISRNLTYVIGRKNTLLALRGRLVPTVQYFEEQLAIQNNYIKALRAVRISAPDANIPVNLTSREII